MKEILARIYFLYLALLFVLTMIPVAIVVFIQRIVLSDQQFPQGLHKTFQVWMGIYMRLIFCPVKHYGREHFENGKNYVVVINHNSFMDVPVSAPGIPVPSKTLAKIEISKVPIFGYIYSQGSILVDRKSRRSRVESFRKMKEVLEQGISLGLYPEGTRNNTDKLLAEFKDGAFKIALDCKTDIIPGVILGTKNILHPTKKLYAWPHKIQFHFLPAVSIKNYQKEQVSELRNDVHRQMLSFIEKKTKAK